LLENLQSHHLRVLECTAEITVGIEDFCFPLDLVLRFPSNRKIDLANLVEAVGNITSDDLHPDVAAALQDVDLAVAYLIDKALRIITDRVESVRNHLIALADLHLGS